MASRDAAESAWEDVTESGVEEVRAFVPETAFDSGERLVYVHSYGSQNCSAMTLDGAPRIADDGPPAVETSLTRTAPADQPCGDAIASVHILLRLSFDSTAAVPDVVEAHVAGARDGPDELRLEAKR